MQNDLLFSINKFVLILIKDSWLCRIKISDISFVFSLETPRYGIVEMNFNLYRNNELKRFCYLYQR